MSNVDLLLTTKLHAPPSRPVVIARPRLSARLAEGLARPVTLLSAPAGFGKTTLVSAWLAECDCLAAWLSLDEGDSDPAHFFAYLLAALQTVDPALGQSVQLLLMAQPLPPLDALTATLVHELASRPDTISLVLDDYHRIQGDAVHSILRFLVEHQPPNLRLILLSREDPPLPLARLRVRGQLVELREADLRFTPEEAAAFLAQTIGLRLPAAAIADLVERAEGWIAALQIAGLSLQGRNDAEAYIAAFHGDDRFLMDYLMDEVFSRQPPEIQEFLLQTAILERLCAKACDAVVEISDSANRESRITPFADSQAILEHLERANLFLVPLDNRRQWYRYHHLFADLLHYRLQRTHPERLPELHRRACRWYADAGDPDEAMRHALAIPDAALAADLAERYMLPMIGSSQLVTYLGWIGRIPETVIFDRAYLCAGYGWACVLTNCPEAAARYADAGEMALARYEPVRSAPDGRPISAAEVAGNLSAIRSYAARARGDMAEAIEQAQRALAALPPAADAIRCAVAYNLGMLRLDAGELEPARQAFYEAVDAARRSRTNPYVAITALSQLGGIAAGRGKLREAERLFQAALGFAADEMGMATPAPAAGVAHGWLMWLHYQRNDITGAQAHLDHVLATAGQTGIPAMTARAYTYQALLAGRRGELDAAAGWYDRAAELLRAHAIGGLVQAEWIAFRGQLCLRQGDTVAAAALLAAQGFTVNDLNERAARWLAPRLAGYVLLARVLVAQGAVRQAVALLERITALAEQLPDAAVQLEALALHAVLRGAERGDVSAGLPLLQRALDLAAPEDFARPILDAGSALDRLLRQAIMEGIQPAFAQRLLVDLLEEERRWAVAGQVVGTSQAPEAAVEIPTARERQVLRLLAAGLSSNEIAAELVISVSTARSYIKSLYGKLDVHGRAEAIDRVRQLGLL